MARPDDPSRLLGNAAALRQRRLVIVAQYSALNHRGDPGREISDLLLGQGITPFLSGSRGVNVRVLEEDAARARELILGLLRSKRIDATIFDANEAPVDTSTESGVK